MVRGMRGHKGCMALEGMSYYRRQCCGSVTFGTDPDPDPGTERYRCRGSEGSACSSRDSNPET
jgi:hypothetical protein